MSDKRYKPCGAEDCCFCDDKQQHEQLQTQLTIATEALEAAEITLHRIAGHANGTAEENRRIADEGLIQISKIKEGYGGGE